MMSRKRRNKGTADPFSKPVGGAKPKTQFQQLSRQALHRNWEMKPAGFPDEWVFGPLHRPQLRVYATFDEQGRFVKGVAVNRNTGKQVELTQLKTLVGLIIRQGRKVG